MFKYLKCTPDDVLPKDVNTMIDHEKKGWYPITWCHEFKPNDSKSNSAEVQIFCNCSFFGSHKQHQTELFPSVTLEGEVLRIFGYY